MITSGARRKEQRWDPKDNEQIATEGRFVLHNEQIATEGRFVMCYIMKRLLQRVGL